MSQLLQLACPTAPNPARPPSKNRVGGSPRSSALRAPKTRSQLPESHRVSRPDATITASGRPVWPNRDPIEEAGGLALYSAMANSAVTLFDSLGLRPLTPEEKKYIEDVKRKIADEKDPNRRILLSKKLREWIAGILAQPITRGCDEQQIGQIKQALSRACDEMTKEWPFCCIAGISTSDGETSGVDIFNAACITNQKDDWIFECLPDDSLMCTNPSGEYCGVGIPNGSDLIHICARAFTPECGGLHCTIMEEIAHKMVGDIGHDVVNPFLKCFQCAEDE